MASGYLTSIRMLEAECKIGCSMPPLRSLPLQSLVTAAMPADAMLGSELRRVKARHREFELADHPQADSVACSLTALEQ